MTRNATATSTSPWRRLALGFVFAWFFIGGVFHFTATPAFVSIMPPYAPVSYTHLTLPTNREV